MKQIKLKIALYLHNGPERGACRSRGIRQKLASIFEIEEGPCVDGIILLYSFLLRGQ